MGLDEERFDFAIRFYTAVENPAQTQNRDDCLGALMTWDMGMDLSWVWNNVHHTRC